MSSQSAEDRVKVVIGSLVIEREVLAAENERLKAELADIKRQNDSKKE